MRSTAIREAAEKLAKWRRDWNLSAFIPICYESGNTGIFQIDQWPIVQSNSFALNRHTGLPLRPKAPKVAGRARRRHLDIAGSGLNRIMAEMSAEKEEAGLEG